MRRVVPAGERTLRHACNVGAQQCVPVRGNPSLHYRLEKAPKSHNHQPNGDETAAVFTKNRHKTARRLATETRRTKPRLRRLYAIFFSSLSTRYIDSPCAQNGYQSAIALVKSSW